MSGIRFHRFLFLILLGYVYSTARYETDLKFRIEAGSKTCFFEKGKVGQMLETQYQVIDGQHGDLDISFEIIDPKGNRLVSDYKKTQNSVIFELDQDGDYTFCMDNSFSIMNSKLVFVYVLIEDKTQGDEEVQVTVISEDGEEEEEAVLEWMGYTADGEPYYIEVRDISDALMRTLRHVARARHLLDFYAAIKSRDSYLAFEDTFIVDAWSGLQITCMLIVGVVQVYMIKKLFNRVSENEASNKNYY